MKIEKKEYKEIAYQIIKGDGDGYIELEKLGEILSFKYEIQYAGYTETGGFIVKGIELFISDIECYDEYGKYVESDFNEIEIYNTVRRMVA